MAITSHEYMPPLLSPQSRNPRIRKMVRKVYAKAEAERRTLNPAALALLEDIERRHMNALLFGNHDGLP